MRQEEEREGDRMQKWGFGNPNWDDFPLKPSYSY